MNIISNIVINRYNDMTFLCNVFFVRALFQWGFTEKRKGGEGISSLRRKVFEKNLAFRHNNKKPLSCSIMKQKPFISFKLNSQFIYWTIWFLCVNKMKLEKTYCSIHFYRRVFSGYWTVEKNFLAFFRSTRDFSVFLCSKIHQRCLGQMVKLV